MLKSIPHAFNLIQMTSSHGSILTSRMASLPSMHLLSTTRSYYGSDASFGQLTPPYNFGIMIVPEKTAFVVERFGRFNRVLSPGLHFLIPSPVDRVAYVHLLKEQAIPIQSQQAITRSVREASSFPLGDISFPHSSSLLILSSTCTCFTQG